MVNVFFCGAQVVVYQSIGRVEVSIAEWIHGREPSRRRWRDGYSIGHGISHGTRAGNSGSGDRGFWSGAGNICEGLSMKTRDSGAMHTWNKREGRHGANGMPARRREPDTWMRRPVGGGA